MADHNMAVNDSEVDFNDDTDIPKVSKKQKSHFIDGIVDQYTPNKKQKLDKHLYKAPTAEELNQLRETENLFHSNLFRLQIDEILKAVRIKNKNKKLFNSWFESFKDQINKIDATKEINFKGDLLSEKSGIRIPMEYIAKDYPGTFTFAPPSNITVGGSYSLDTLVGPHASVDVFVEMPKSIFQRVDNRNYGYMRKKAIYLSLIASNINEELAESKSFIGNHLNPILKIVPKGKLSNHITIHVCLVVENTTFPLDRYTPEKNNIRPNWYFKDNGKTYEYNPPTPLYNHMVMHDLTTLKSNNENAEQVKIFPNIRDGIILLKIWLKQRDLCNNFESVNGHVITMYVLYLLHKKILNKYMSSYQILRNTWTYLAKNDWNKNGISFCEGEKINERIVLYKKYYDCVFLDNTGFCNITPNISESTARWISNQAEMAINCLNNTRMNDFLILFMRKVPFYLSFDHIICLHNVTALQNVIEAKSSDDDKLNYGSNKYMQACKFVTSILKEGLKNRISIMMIMPHKMKEWNLNEKIPEDREKIYVGIQLNSEFAFNIVERGPEANLPEAQEFRKYWGDKSDLRRFKDSTVCEAVVWLKEGATLAERRTIPQRIIKYLFESKLKLFEKLHYLIISNEADRLLSRKKVVIPRGMPYGTEELALRVIQAFDSLKADLSNENFSAELPLSIHGIQGCSPVFRYTEVFPPQALSLRADEKNIISGESHQLFAGNKFVEEVPPYLGLIEATMQLSMSGRWPDELEALRMTKAAFYIQIADCVRNKYKLLAHGSMHHIDIMKDGFVFRLKITHEKEIGLVKQVIDKSRVLKYRDNEESIELEKNLFQLPKLTGALHGLYCQQPSFGPACCLIKRWLSAQLIDETHMPGLVVELLVASMYLNPEPYVPTQVPQVTFMRFLESFAREHWTTDPIIVNFNNEMTREEVIEVENQFGENRDSLPPLFISSPYDKTSNWTIKAPSTLILNRITDLAKESLKLIEKQIYEYVSLSFESLFIPPLLEYDCLIRLKKSLCARRFEAVNINDDAPLILYPFKEHKNNKIPIVDFDPVAEYLKEIRSIYNDFALFFHDTYGGTVIGVLLKPNALEKKDFKVKKVSCQKLHDNKLILNVSAMLEDFYILGKGLVENIDVQSKNIC